MTCQEFVELVTDYLEGGLDPRTERLFTEHLAGCPGCGPYLSQVRTTVELLRTLRAGGGRRRRPGRPGTR